MSRSARPRIPREGDRDGAPAPGTVAACIAQSVHNRDVEYGELKQAFKGGNVDTLIEGLRDTSPRVRRGAAFYLGRLGRPAVVPALVAALDDREGGTSKTELRGRLQALEGLDERLRASEATEVRKGLVRALADVGDEAAMARVVEAALSDSDVEVRRTAASALRKFRDPDPVPALIQALDDPDDSVRMLTVASLSHLGDERAIPRLVEVVRTDPSLGPASAAADLLVKLGDPAPAVEHFLSLLTDADRELAGGRHATWIPLSLESRLVTRRYSKVRRRVQKRAAKRLVELRATDAAPEVEGAAATAGSLRERMLLRRTARRLRRLPT